MIVKRGMSQTNTAMLIPRPRSSPTMEAKGVDFAAIDTVYTVCGSSFTFLTVTLEWVRVTGTDFRLDVVIGYIYQ